jgi:hypothetical protein
VKTVETLIHPETGIDLAETARQHGLRIDKCEACGQEELRKQHEPSQPCFRCELNKPPPVLPEYLGQNRQEWRTILYEAREAYMRGEVIDRRFSLTDHLTEVVLENLSKTSYDHH